MTGQRKRLLWYIQFTNQESPKNVETIEQLLFSVPQTKFFSFSWSELQVKIEYEGRREEGKKGSSVTEVLKSGGGIRSNDIRSRIAMAKKRMLKSGTSLKRKKPLEIFRPQ